MPRFDRDRVKMKLETTELEQTALISFYEVDLKPFGGDILRFHSGVNELLDSVIWQGHKYGAYPVQASGFDIKAKGTSSRPALTFANLDGTITGLVADFNEMIGATVTRRQVYAKFLDAANFKNGNLQADPLQELVSIYVIEQLDKLDDVFASFTLSLPSEMEGLYIPKRVVIANVCPWRYRSGECGYSGGAVADNLDKPTNDISKDQCSKSLKACKMRFGEHGILNFGGFPSTVV